MATDARLSVYAANLAADAVCRAADGGMLRILDDDGVSLVALPFGSPAFGPAVDGIAQAQTIKAADALRQGTAARFSVENGSGIELWSGTVGTKDANLNLKSVAFSVGAEIDISAFTYRQKQTE